MLKNSPLIKLPHRTRTIAPTTKAEAARPRQRFAMAGRARFVRTMRKTANPQQKKSIGQAALFIGTCSVAAADTQITSSESQVLKRNQLLAGIQCRRVLNVIFRIPSNARVESQAKPINRRILRRTGYELTLWMRVGRIS